MRAVWVQVPAVSFKMENGPDDFEFKDDDTPVVRAFKETKTHMWFREPIDDPDAVINNLPLR